MPKQVIDFVTLAASCEAAGLIVTAAHQRATAEWTRADDDEEKYAVPLRLTDRAVAIYTRRAEATESEAALLNALAVEMQVVRENGDPNPGVPHPLFEDGRG